MWLVAVVGRCFVGCEHCEGSSELLRPRLHCLPPSLCANYLWVCVRGGYVVGVCNCDVRVCGVC